MKHIKIRDMHVDANESVVLEVASRDFVFLGRVYVDTLGSSPWTESTRKPHLPWQLNAPLRIELKTDLKILCASQPGPIPESSQGNEAERRDRSKR